MARVHIPTGRTELERRIVGRAQKDPEFRARLLDDPKAALAELLGAELPAALEVEVVQERPDRMCIVLPVDLSGMGIDAVHAMIGHQPEVDE